jgi:hypothetical protein
VLRCDLESNAAAASAKTTEDSFTGVIIWVPGLCGRTVQGVFVGSQDFVRGHYLEFHTYNSHGNCFYVYLMSICTLLDVKNPYSDYLDLQTDIRAK